MIKGITRIPIPFGSSGFCEHCGDIEEVVEYDDEGTIWCSICAEANGYITSEEQAQDEAEQKARNDADPKVAFAKIRELIERTLAGSDANEYRDALIDVQVIINNF